MLVLPSFRLMTPHFLCSSAGTDRRENNNTYDNFCFLKSTGIAELFCCILQNWKIGSDVIFFVENFIIFFLFKIMKEKTIVIAKINQRNVLKLRFRKETKRKINRIFSTM